MSVFVMAKNKNGGGNGSGNGGGYMQNGSKDIIVLATHMHCEGCATDIIKCLRGFEGVEDVRVDLKEHRVLVKGKQANPSKVLEGVRARCINKHVELISPKLKPMPKPDPTTKHKEVEDDNEVFASILVSTEVQMVTIDAKIKQMTVVGGINPQNLVTYLYTNAGKHATIVKKEYKDKEKAAKRLAKLKKSGNNTIQGNVEVKNDEQKKPKDGYYHYPPQYNPDPLYPCLLLNDENPHACGIM